jgi:alcohol dehydrogenase
VKVGAAMKEFEFSIPQKVVYGAGSLSKLSEVVNELGGKKAFIISGPHLYKMGLVSKCAEALEEAGIACGVFADTEANPSTDTVEKATRMFIESDADCIIAFGGGSPIDVAKAAAIVAKYGGDITDYEGSGTVPGSVVPIVAIPTTAGTGSEVTSFSVITDHNRNYKLTVGSDNLIPAYAILDPELITTVPQKTAAACGMDAMVHAIEAYISLAASPFSEIFSLYALDYIGGSIRDYVADRKNLSAAENMMLGSLFAGIAFSHARLGNVHAMSHPVSAYYDVPHGVANAIILPIVVEFNMKADAGKYYEIYKRIAAIPCSKEQFKSEKLISEIRRLIEELGIPNNLQAVGVDDALINKMSEDAMKSGNIKVNPRTTEIEDIKALYKEAINIQTKVS